MVRRIALHLVARIVVNAGSKIAALPRRMTTDMLVINSRDRKFYISKELACQQSKVLKEYVADCEEHVSPTITPRQSRLEFRPLI